MHLSSTRAPLYHAASRRRAQAAGRWERKPKSVVNAPVDFDSPTEYFDKLKAAVQRILTKAQGDGVRSLIHRLVQSELFLRK